MRCCATYVPRATSCTGVPLTSPCHYLHWCATMFPVPLPAMVCHYVPLPLPALECHLHPPTTPCVAPLSTPCVAVPPARCNVTATADVPPFAPALMGGRALNCSINQLRPPPPLAGQSLNLHQSRKDTVCGLFCKGDSTDGLKTMSSVPGNISSLCSPWR